MSKKAAAKKKDLADRLVAWREKMCFSQLDAANALGVSKRSLQEWEQRRATPRFEPGQLILERLIKDGC